MMDMSKTPDPRSVEILDKIKAVFQQKGFDGASMQDLARAAGMSAGNFYRYFPSKDAIIQSMVEHDLGDVADIFGRISTSENPRRAFLDALRVELREHQATCDGPLWAEIEAASCRRPEIAAITGRMEREVGDHMLNTFALMNGLDPDQCARRFAHHAELIVILFKGVAMQPNISSDLLDLTIATVDRLLDDIVRAGNPTPEDVAQSSQD